MKFCGGCKETKGYSFFGANTRTGDGFRTQCKPCTSKNGVAAAARKRKILADYKMEMGCTDCGYRDHPDALEFDHLPMYHKDFTIGSALNNKGIDTLMREVAKCEVVCANCHRIRSANRREK